MDPGRLLDRQVARIRALEDLVYVEGGTPVKVNETRAIAHEPTRKHELALSENHRQPVPEGKLGNLAPLPGEERIAEADAGVGAFLRDTGKGFLDFFGRACVHSRDLDTDLLRGGPDDFQDRRVGWIA